MHLLKSNSIIKLSFSFSFTIKFAFINSSSLRAENWLFFKIIISLVYIPMILNRVPVVVIRKYMSQYVPTRYKVLCIIDKRCRVRIYVGGEVVYIYMSLRGQVCARVIATPSHNNAPGQCRDNDHRVYDSDTRYTKVVLMQPRRLQPCVSA